MYYSLEDFRKLMDENTIPVGEEGVSGEEETKKEEGEKETTDEGEEEATA